MLLSIYLRIILCNEMRGAKRVGRTPRGVTRSPADDGVDILSPQVALMHTHSRTIQHRRTCCSETVPEPL